MKRTKILPTLSKLFENPPVTIAKSYKLGWLNDKIILVSSTCPLQPEVIFGVFHKATIVNGLDSKEWDRLERKIVSFMTQKGYL